MRESDLHSTAAPTAAEEQIDRICDAFEANLKAGCRPDLAQLLRQVPADWRESLLIELVLVGLEYAGTSARGKRPGETTVGDLKPPGFLVPSQPAERTVRSCTEASTMEPSEGGSHAAPPPTLGGYELFEELGRGGMGVVYRARQASLDRIVALKVIRGRFDDGDPARRAVLMNRFRTEAKAASRLDHENIATVYEIGECGDTLYYAMRLVEGPSLGKIVQAGPLPADRAARYLAPIARAISRLHSLGVLHRDLKPSNIVVEAASDTPVLTDFGLAKLVDAQQQVTLTDETFGSPPYMAPEQVLHATSVTGAADVYSLGATLYHLLTGQPPFQSNTLPEFARQIVFLEPTPPRQLNTSIPRDLETICLKCLQKDENRRYASADDLAEDLERFLAGRPIVARPIGKLGRLWRWSLRNPAWPTLAISMTVLLIISAAAFAFMHLRARGAAAVAEGALDENRRNKSSERFEKSQFVAGENPHDSLPWLIACLKLDAGTPREAATRQRIYSLLHHGPELAHVWCHDGPVNCAGFSARGDQVITGSTDRTARIWSTRTGECLQTFHHRGSVREALLSHHSILAMTATADGTVQLWAADSGRKIGRALPHPGYLTSAMFSADDELLITAAADDRVRLWNTSDATLQKEIAAGDAGKPIVSMALSPDGSRGVSSSGGTLARVWNPRTGEIAFDLNHSDSVCCAQFSPDGAMIVTAGADGKARVWDAETGHPLHEFSHVGAVTQARFAADSQRVITTTDEAAFIWSLNPRSTNAVKLDCEQPTGIAIDPTNSAVLILGNAQTARMWNLQDGAPRGAPFFHASRIRGAQFTDDGGSLLTFSADATARVWNRGNRLWQRQIVEGATSLKLHATPDGQSILAWTETGALRVLRKQAPQTDDAAYTHELALTAACLSPNAVRIAAADTKGNLIVWNRETGQRMIRQSGLTNTCAIRFAADNQTVAIGDAHGHVIVIDVESTDSADLSRSFTLSGRVVELMFNPRGDLLLAAGSQSARLVSFNPEDDNERSPIELGSEIRGAQFSPDGNYIVIYGTANRALLLGIADGSRRTLDTDSPVNHASFTSNSSQLLTVEQKGSAHVWRVVDGSRLYETIHDSVPLMLGAFSPSGETIVLCGDRTARIWHLVTGQPATVKLNHADDIAYGQFVDPQHLLTITDAGDVQVADLIGTGAALDELELMSMARTGWYVDASGIPVRVSGPALTRLCRKYDIGAKDGRSGGP